MIPDSGVENSGGGSGSGGGGTGGGSGNGGGQVGDGTDVGPGDRVSYRMSGNVDPEQFGEWGTMRLGYDTAAALPAPVTGGIALVASGSLPAVNASWSGPINGRMNPYWPELSDPRIVLGVRLSGSHGSVTARTTYDIDGEDTDTVLTVYSARLQPDGTFGAFDGVTEENPSGFSGAFYGSSHEVVQGHVVTPFVFGSYRADKD